MHGGFGCVRAFPVVLATVRTISVTSSLYGSKTIFTATPVKGRPVFHVH
jgi:hypothetical protein